MHRTVRRWRVVPAAVLLFAAAGTPAPADERGEAPAGVAGEGARLAVQAEVVPLDGMQGLSTVHRYRLDSEPLGTTYTVLVRVPEPAGGDGGGATAQRLPAVYLLDGGITFPALGAYYRYLELAGEVPELILVGISYGTDDWQAGNRRSRDYTAPSPERNDWGGVGAFLDFVASRVVPLIEDRYPADPARRILFGQSLGGQAAIYAAQRRPELFWGHIASNPALHRNLDYFLAAPAPAAAGKRDGESVPRLFVSSAENDAPRFREPALRWMRHWDGARRDWVLETRTLAGHNHFSALPEAFRQGLVWLFSQPPPKR